ncbi:hypothetical protein Skr01_41760 [Sphaerisporangium krabiense]|uniref:Uncharacterized protein (DUF2252 family) n=1 Tax=Sphaerisporangium krabiense TaxID=763782 RepID=A0A7W8Z1C6_9ACTN|nr:DUF2252 family protein [Sphaerisporangium krabiense]MBB5625395.1 uncharacterized protein (DUF2252 family) [Sphaerisporangium krabiense]GII64091.1 hypothetical protein Skr01_41760 [Sphaerisporangium krabiense]
MSAGALIIAMGSIVPVGPAEAALSRDPVAVIYQRDHALHTLNNGATDDDLLTRTEVLASSPWAFFRGTSPLYYRDLAELPASAYATAGGDVWITGDAHLENTGADRGADNVEQFALTDTDDAWRGSWTWELRREAVSIVLAGRRNGRSASQIATDVNTLVSEYAQWIGKFHGNDDEAGFRLTAGNTSDLTADLIAKSDDDKRADLLAKWTTLTGSTRTFKADPQLQTVSASTRSAVAAAVAAYRTTAQDPLSASEAVVKDVRRRLGAGAGSLGRFRWYALIEGDGAGTSDDRILELKQQVDPAPKPLAPGATTLSGGQRPALALRWLVDESDPLAGWASVGGVPVLVKEKSPFAEDLSTDDLTTSAIWDDSVRDIGRLLAAAHSRADKDIAGTGVAYSADAAIDNAITSVSGLQAETRGFATGYADQVTGDWQSYVTAKNNGVPLF